MSLATAIAIYFIIWWVVLFAVLPWGIRSQRESGDVIRGTDPGAPHIPRLASKFVYTTIIAAFVFMLWYALYTSRVISLDQIGRMFGVVPR